MQRAEPRLFRLLAEESERLGPRADERCRELYQAIDYRRIGGRARLSYESIAVMMFLTADADLDVGEETLANVQAFALRQELYYPATQGNRKDAIKRLMAAWLEATGERAEAYGQVRVALQYGLPEGLKPALKIIDTPGAAPSEVAQALLAVGKFGDKSHASKLERLVDDATVVYHTSIDGRTAQIQVRDFALAMVLHLAGRDPADYGYTRIRPSPTTVYEQTSLTFENDAAREEAIRKWKEAKAAS
jgi:hypothetical protein